MIEHWYEYLPAAWFTPEGRWYVFISLLIIFSAGYLLGFFMGRRTPTNSRKSEADRLQANDKTKSLRGAKP